MTLTLDLETLFKVTAHPLSKGTLWVKYELNWANERETSDKLSRMDRWAEVWTVRETNHYTIGQPLSRALI